MAEDLLQKVRMWEDRSFKSIKTFVRIPAFTQSEMKRH